MTYIPDINSATNTVTVTSNYTATSNDNSIKVDTTSGSLTVTLMAATSRPIGAQIRVKKISSDTNTLTVVTAGGNIDGASSFATNSTVKPSYTLETDGTNYIKV